MSTSVASLSSNFFPSAENGFTTTTSGSVSSGAATVGLNSVAGYTNGEVAVFVIDPTDPTKKQTFTGVVDTSGSQITNVVWTAGSNTTHALGATVVDYATATHISMISKGLLVEHNQDGTHADITADSVTTDEITATTGTFTSLTINGAATEEGWSPLGDVPDTVTALGNRSYNLVFNGNDLTDTVSNGMRLKLTRTVTAPTQCADLEASSSQYFSKTSPAGMTFTDDFTVSAWIKLESYTGAVQTIASRYNGTSGWIFYLNAAGQLALQGNNAGSSNLSSVTSSQSIPLGEWVHVAAQLDMSTFTATTTTSYVMINGLDVPATVARGGTNPTALVQAGNLEIGSSNGGSFFDGKIAQVAIYSAKVTQATILASMNQTLTGSETNLVSAFSLNNTLNDLSANANNLTAQGSAVATNVDSPMNSTEYGVIMANSFSTNTTLTVQVPEGYTLPTSGGIGLASYSTQHVPYGFPGISNIIGYAQNNTAFAGTTNGGNGDNVSGLVTTVTAPAGKQIRFIVGGKSVKSSGSAGGTTSVRVVEGTTEIAGFTAQIPVVGYNTNPNFTSHPFTPPPGAHTYQVNIVQSGAGTQTFDATTTAPASLTVEVVGGL